MEAKKDAMRSPYERLINDDDLESMREYAQKLLTQPDELANVHVVRLAGIVRALYEHIQAVEEIEVIKHYHCQP